MRRKMPLHYLWCPVAGLWQGQQQSFSWRSRRSWRRGDGSLRGSGRRRRQGSARQCRALFALLAVLHSRAGFLFDLEGELDMDLGDGDDEAQG